MINQDSYDALKRELKVIKELRAKGTLDNYNCDDITKMAEERKPTE
jgi:hypothetical protein